MPKNNDYRQRNDWVLGLAELGESIYSLRFNRGYQPPLPRFDRCANLGVALNAPDQNGFPLSDETLRLFELEARIDAAHKEHAILVGTLTGQGVKMFILYVRDIDWLSQLEDAERTVVGGYQLTIKVEDDPRWNRFGEFLSAAERADADRRVFDLLESRGPDLGHPRQIDWFLHFTAESNAQRARRWLLDHEYLASLTRSVEEDLWDVTASLFVPIDRRYAIQMSAMFDAFAKEYQGVYGGWGAVST
jgi:hypothetical protein